MEGDMTHTYLDTTIDFNVIYERRKNVGIYVDVYGYIEVHAPKDSDIIVIQKALEKQWELILLKSKEMKDRNLGSYEKVYEHGETFLYLGKAYPIVITCNSDLEKDCVILEDDKLYINVKQQDDDVIRQALKRFYYQNCKSVIEKRIRFFQSEFKVKPRSIKITDDKKNWGTCNSKYELTFNWKLIMAPIEVIDYVVVHEMCHTVHLNHDRSFWRLVGKVIPDYERRQNWLALSGWKMIL
jgi:predicted metal-dependent hydrolase